MNSKYRNSGSAEHEKEIIILEVCIVLQHLFSILVYDSCMSHATKGGTSPASVVVP